MNRSREIVRNAALGIITGYVLSVLFYLIFGVFQLVGFIVWSLVTGAIGGIIGGLVIRNPVGPILFAAILRILWFAVATGFRF